MRSVRFEIPKPRAPNPGACQTPVVDPSCFAGVADLGADDVMRGRDHGMPTYNELRKAYGLPPKPTFTALTGESTSGFPVDARLDPSDPIDDPDILMFTQLRDVNGKPLDPADPNTQDNTVFGTRLTTLAARLKAIYGATNAVDAFVGMVSEPHLPGSDLGELQMAMWKKQFTALRDGDRYFYANDPAVAAIQSNYGVGLLTLSQIIAANAGPRVDNPFVAGPTAPGRHRHR
jgi:hypothetical protein